MSDRADRIDELEGKVRELEATVKGVTEELVEANERIRELEAELDEKSGRQGELDQVVADGSADGRQVAGGRPKDGQRTRDPEAGSGQSPQAVEANGQEDAGKAQGTDQLVEGSTDGIVDGDAGPGHEEAAEAGRPMAEGSQDSSDDGDSDGDDIIIA